MKRDRWLWYSESEERSDIPTGTNPQQAECMLQDTTQKLQKKLRAEFLPHPEAVLRTR